MTENATNATEETTMDAAIPPAERTDKPVAWRQGAQAFIDGEGPDANPYNAETDEEQQQWHRGYVEQCAASEGIPATFEEYVDRLDLDAADDQPTFELLVRLLVAQGAEEEDAREELLTLQNHLQTPNTTLARIMLALMIDQVDFIEMHGVVLLISAQAQKERVETTALFDNAVALRGFQSVARIDPETYALCVAEIVQTVADAPAAEETETITTEELLRERPIEPGPTEMHTLWTPLSVERKMAILEELAEATIEEMSLEEEKKATAKRYSDRINAIAARREKLAECVENDSEETAVACRWFIDWTNGRKELRRLDTDAVVDEQYIPMDERQQRLEIEEPIEETAPAVQYNHCRCNACGWTWSVAPTSDLAADAACPNCDSRAVSLHGDPYIAEQLELEEERAESHSAAYLQGRAACESEDFAPTNPYDSTQPEHEEWLAGWNDAVQERDFFADAEQEKEEAAETMAQQELDGIMQRATDEFNATMDEAMDELQREAEAAADAELDAEMMQAAANEEDAE